MGLQHVLLTLYHRQPELNTTKPKGTLNMQHRHHKVGTRIAHTSRNSGVKHCFRDEEDFLAFWHDDYVAARANGDTWLPRDLKGFGRTPEEALLDLQRKAQRHE